MNFKILIIMMSNVLGPTLSTTSCYYSQFKDESQAAIINDYVRNTSWISRTFVLSNIEKWENNNLIKDISNINNGDVQLSEILQWYFGNQVINEKSKWSAETKYFIEDDNLLQKVISNKEKYTMPYKKQKQLKETLTLVKTILNALSVLDTKLINTAFGDDGLIEQNITEWITGEKLKEIWDNNLKTIFPVLPSFYNKIKEYNNFINEKTYNEVLEVASTNIQNMIINIFDSSKTYEKNLEDNIKISLIDDKDINFDATNFIDKLTTFFKKPENFITYIPDFLAIVNYLVYSYSKIPYFNVNTIWPPIIPGEITDVFDKIGNEKYQGLNSDHIKNLKTLFKGIFNSLKHDGLSLRKILLSIEQNEWLNKLVSPIKLVGEKNLDPIISMLVRNTAAGVKSNIFNELYNNNKNEIIKFLPIKYLEFISNSITNESSFDFNNVLLEVSTLLDKVATKINDQVIDKVVNHLKNKDKKQTLNEIKKVLGISKDENFKLVIEEDSILDILLKVNETTDFKNFINLISGDQEFIDKFIISNDKEINENYLDFFWNDKYWSTSNINYKYLENNGIEISYNLKYFKSSKLNYFFKWKSELNKNNFKLTDFQTF